MNKPLLLLLISFILISISGVIAVGTYPAVDSNMVLYYHFNNDSFVGENYTNINESIYDYSNGKNNGTYVNQSNYFTRCYAVCFLYYNLFNNPNLIYRFNKLHLGVRILR